MVHFKYYDLKSSGGESQAPLVSIENLFQAWDEFKKGKKKKIDVQVFEKNLEDNLFDLYLRLKNRNYKHGKYKSFYVNDPKRRHIHKTCISDRIVHHLLYKYLYDVFDKDFIYDSYSCRLDKGTHRAVKRLAMFVRKVSRNYTSHCWVLKCDIKRFFTSVDQEILLNLLEKKTGNTSVFWLLKEIIESFNSESGKGKGIPLGNLTSQIFANVYLNELDQFVKHKLKIKYYLRYADDFLLVSKDENILLKCIDPIREFLKDRLLLELHPQKIILRKLKQGIDFLGYIVLPYTILPRTKTKRRMFRKLRLKIKSDSFNQSLQSYLGYLSHANSHDLALQLIFSLGV